MQRRLDIFSRYYEALYSPVVGAWEEVVMDFLGKVRIPCLTPIDRDKLEEPIKLDEVLLAIRALKASKSPGLDGLTGEFYRMFQDQLGPVHQKV